MLELDALAEALDDWASARSVAITETTDVIVVYQLDGSQARTLAGLAAAADLPVAFEDMGGDLELNQITEGLSRITARISLPPAPAEVERVLTNAGFEAALKRGDTSRRLWVRRLSAAFESLGVRYSPWDDPQDAPAAEPWPSLGKVVRLLGTAAGAQTDLPRWILRDPTAALPTGAAFEIWKVHAAGAAALALANELEPDGKLLFRGPPTSRFTLDGVGALTTAGFEALQRAALWAYESLREVENRQGLLAAEIARAGVRDGELQDLADVAGHALDGARIAYQFGVTQQSRDTLKALGDLRKAVMDETAKVAEITRGLVAAVAGAVFGNIGVIVARLTLPANASFIGPAALIVGVVLALYVVGVIASGFHFLHIQRKNRAEWRPRLYSFLTPADYRTLVEMPVKRVEVAFLVTAIVGAVMATLLLAAVVVIALAAPAQRPAANPDEAAKTETSPEGGPLSRATPAPAPALAPTEKAPPSGGNGADPKGVQDQVAAAPEANQSPRHAVPVKRPRSCCGDAKLPQ